MKALSSPYRNIFIAGLLVQVITAWFSVGYFHPDEHYQVLEFCNYKLGFSPLKDLPWEYLAHCRAALQPAIAYCVSSFFLAIGAYNPFMVAFVLRLMVGVLTWYTTLRVVTILLRDFKTERGRQFFVACSFLLWFVPYIGVRFSAEAISADLFFLALTLLYKKEYRGQNMLLTGLLLGFALFFRLQVGFAFIGLAIWLLFILRPAFSQYLLLVAGGVVAIGCSILIDHWFYGQWVLTPLNYFNVNIIQHVAAKFGVDPWWYYFKLFINMGIVPLSVPLLLLFFRGIWFRPWHLFSLVCYTFFVGHILIGHKEMRFLFPASIAFIFLACLGMEQVMKVLPQKGILNVFFRLLVTINMAILLFKMFTPAEELMKYFGFIYSYAQKQNTTIVSFKESPYKLDVIECNFYKPKNLDIEVLKDSASLRTLLQNNKGQAVIYLSRTLQPGPELNGFKTEKIYCEFPDWLLQFNINHWEDRSYIWSVYRIIE